MTRRFCTPGRTKSSYHCRPNLFRPRVETLEERLAPAGLLSAIVVGRTLSTCTTGGVQDHALTVTYTVYNEQAGDVSSVLLTTTLQPGIDVQSASAVPNRSGQELAWSLGTLPAFGRVSVTITIQLPNLTALQIDGGAAAFGTVDVGTVTDAAPAAVLTTRALPAAELAATPDANTADPFVQEQAAKLDYDPQRIFDYLNDGVGYESYVGSLRGARGTLWSAAGNSLDEASLGVALFRASGIPARYARGTLSDPLSQQLILSMFPDVNQTVGYIPAGTPVADPANDPQLLAETRDHYWLQVDTGAGFQNADTSGLPGGAIGTAFTTATGTFSEVADALRHKVRLTLDAEIYNSAIAAFGGNPLGTQTVLDRTFDAVDLVGKPLTLGHFVSQSGTGAGPLAATTNTYSPYLIVGDDADVDQEDIIRGTDYQEVITNFPLATTVVTGLFLGIDLSGPDGPTESFDRTLADRIGFAVRQNGGRPNLSFDPSGPPAVGPLDVWTLGIQASRQSGQPAFALDAQFERDRTRLAGLLASGAQLDLPRAALDVARRGTQSILLSLHASSDMMTGLVADRALVTAYFDRPRVTIVSTLVGVDGAGGSVLRTEVDLRRDSIRSLAAPGQTLDIQPAFQALRGIVENILETGSPSGGPSPGIQTRVSTITVFEAADAQGIDLVGLAPGDFARLDALTLSAEAKARIAVALRAGKGVVVPQRAVVIDGRPAIAWYEADPATGEVVGVGENGGHNGLSQYSAVLKVVLGVIAIGEAGAYSLYSVDQAENSYRAAVDEYRTAFFTITSELLSKKPEQNTPFAYPGLTPEDVQKAKREALELFNKRIEAIITDANAKVTPAIAIVFAEKLRALAKEFILRPAVNDPFGRIEDRYIR